MSIFSSSPSSSQSFLGIDIGSASVKIVELKKEAGQAKLLTYGFSENKQITQMDWQNNISYIAGIINRVYNEAGATSKTAVSALPTFAVFSSILNLSNVNKKDMDSAVHWEAKKVIPLPLEEMILDWKIINSGETAAEQSQTTNKKRQSFINRRAKKFGQKIYWYL